MVKAIDLTGQTFGRLSVIGRDRTDNGVLFWKCKCSCGTEKSVRASLLRNGTVQSCGCWRVERMRKHDKVHTRVYTIWVNIVQRCTNPKVRVYPAYGGRGITFQDSWKTFSGFYADMGDPPSDAHTLERNDVNGNYCKENCRWATIEEQMINKRNNHVITYDGRTQILAQWAREIGVHHTTIRNRLLKGWSVQEALYGKGA